MIFVLRQLKSIWLLVRVLWVFHGGWASAAAKKEVRGFQKTNGSRHRFVTGPVYDLVEWGDRHKIKLLICALFLIAGGLFLSNIEPFLVPLNLEHFDLKHLDFKFAKGHYGLTCKPDIIGCSTSDNNNAIAGTVQATVLGIIIPITIAMHDLVLKGRYLKDEMVGFVIRDTRVVLITMSSLAFLITLGGVEVVKIWIPHLYISIVSVSIAYIWLSLNLALIGYFMQTAIALLSRSKFDAAIRRFTLRDAYPAEMARHIQRNMYVNLTRLNSRS